ncbi:hypothetical protein VVR12_03790 [Rothia sp. LK2588]|uniref:hypothetical protein n=1 Tax=Rothia sp. LK2588 TaxID=3114369 RepID=UPI0034CD6B01
MHDDNFTPPEIEGIDSWQPLTVNDDMVHLGRRESTFQPRQSSTTPPQPFSEPSSTMTPTISLGSLHGSARWVIEYHPGENDDPLRLAAGEYNLCDVTGETPVKSQSLACAERLCALPTHDQIATVQAVLSTADTESIITEATAGGSLLQVLNARGHLHPAEVTTIAENTWAGLQWLHRHQLGFHELSAGHIAFDITAEVKLLPADLELRGATEAVSGRAHTRDHSRLAQIWWRCITGDDPLPENRLPLSLQRPEYPERLGPLLEGIMDECAEEGAVDEVVSLLRHSFTPVPVDLHLSAAPSVRGRLPARADDSSEQRATTPQALRRSQRTQATAHPRRRAGNRRLSRNSSTARLPRWVRPHTPTVVTLGLCAVVGGAVFLTEQHREDTSTSQSATDTTHQVHPPAAQQPASLPSATAAHQPAASDNLTADEAQRQLNELMQHRAHTLRTHDAGLIGRYADEGSALARVDAAMVSQGAGEGMRELQLRVENVRVVSSAAQQATVVADLKATGYQPRPDELAQHPGMSLSSDGAVQRVSFTLVKFRGQDWRVREAVPQQANG